MSEKKIKVKTKTSPRRERTKFRPTFKDRSIYMFSKTGSSLFQLNSTLPNKHKSPHMGMSVLASYKYLSNSIEMLCKATIEQVSSFLLTEKIDDFSKGYLPANYVQNQRTCGGQTALARASKLFRNEITPLEYNSLEKIIDKRNQATHSEFTIKDFRGEIHDLLAGMEVVRKIFDSQFRDANILASAEFYVTTFKNDYEVLLEKNSQDFIKLEKTVQKLSKKFKFMDCFNCEYPFAKL